MIYSPGLKDTINGTISVDVVGATSLGDGAKTVTTAGTRVQLSAISVPTLRITVRANSANTGYVYVGGSTVSSTSGIYLGPQDSLLLAVGNLNAVYIDADVNGEGVKFTYEV